MKGVFNEALLSPKRDPLDAQPLDFDWEGVYSRLDADARDGQNDRAMSETVTRLLQSVIPDGGRYLNPITVGIHVIALAWVVSPAYFEGTPSLRQLARRCGLHPQVLARHTARYSRLLHMRNRAQRHAWNFRKNPPHRNGQAPASRVKELPGGQRRTFTPKGKE